MLGDGNYEDHRHLMASGGRLNASEDKVDVYKSWFNWCEGTAPWTDVLWVLPSWSGVGSRGR